MPRTAPAVLKTSERRIRFVKVGRFVRIPESALREFISAGVVEPMAVSDVWRPA